VKGSLEANIENYRFREALKDAMNIARIGNKYLADTEPWKVIKTDSGRVKTILNIALQITANTAIAIEPFMPFSVVLDIGLERTLHGSYLRNCLTVIIIHLSAGRNFSAVIFLRKHQRTVDEISQHSDQLVVVAGLEILPYKVVILGFGGIGTQHIAQYVLLSGELLQVFMQPYRPVA